MKAKRLMFWACLAGVLYFFLSFHIIFVGKSIKLLKKSNLTLNYTFFSTTGKSNKYILDIEELREDGIADILVEVGKMTEEQKDALLSVYQE